MPIRQRQNPGVEIREIDKSQATPTIVGSSVLVMGYANKGEAHNPVDVVSVADFETNFGTPKNEAERYFYYTCRDVLLENGSLIAAKLPYANTMDVNYKYYPVSVDVGANKTLAQLSATAGFTQIATALEDLNGSTTITNYIPADLGAAANISTSDYDVLVAGGGFTGTSDEFVIVNELKNKRTGVLNDEGMFVTIVDPIHGMLIQRAIAGTDSDPIDLVRQGAAELSGSTFVENLSAPYNSSSISEDLSRKFPTFEFIENGSQISNEYASYLTVVVGKTQVNPNQDGKLEVVLLEAWSGSVLTDAIDSSTGISTYIGDIINLNSAYISWYATVNANQPLSLNAEDCLFTAPYNITLAAFTDAEGADNINGQLVVSDMKTVLEKVSNINDRQIDVVADAGLSTIAQFQETANTSGVFNPLDKNTSPSEIASSSDTTVWRAVVSELDNFCSKIRKDCMAIVDAPRNLVLDADQKYIRKTAPDNTFSNTIGTKLKYITGINSSYVAIYTDWMRMYDTYSGNNIWMPPTTKVAGIYVRNDLTANVWDAPAGLNRGVISEVSDLAFNPTSKEADQLYTKSFNYAINYPLEGPILEGQKTSQVKSSAFDRVNVRRLFLRLERAAYRVSRYQVYQPNNTFTRRNLVAQLDPLFASVKAQGGLYDYRIVCDETNNTADVIDNNELKVAILLKPVRTAEFILVDFIATRTDANFDEFL